MNYQSVGRIFKDLKEANLLIDLVLDAAIIKFFEHYPAEYIINFRTRFWDIFGIDEKKEIKLSNNFLSKFHQIIYKYFIQHYDKRILKNGSMILLWNTGSHLIKKQIHSIEGYSDWP